MYTHSGVILAMFSRWIFPKLSFEYYVDQLDSALKW